MVETIHKVVAEHCDGKIIYSQLFVSAERLLAALGLCTLCGNMGPSWLKIMISN